MGTEKLNGLMNMVLVLVLVAVLATIGVLLFDKMGATFRSTTVVTNESFTLSGGVWPKMHAGVLANTPCITLSAVRDENGTARSLTTFNITFNHTNNCQVMANVPVAGTYQADYTAWDDTPGTTSSLSARDAFTPITKDYYPIIIIVGVFAILLGMLVSAFGGQGMRK